MFCLKNAVLVGVGLVMGLVAVGFSQAATRADSLLDRAAAAAAKGDSKSAVGLLDQLLAASPAEAEKGEAHFLRGREHFRLGSIDESIADLDAVAKLQPQRERELWERGISHYYAGKFADGAKQFELYQTYHDNDVENSVWRYLCIARSDGVEKARESLLPIKNDQRVPMMQIFAMYQGKVKADDVFATAKAGEPSAAELKSRLFYAHLYVGLWHEVGGDAKAAHEHLSLAADQYRIAHYMGDVARVHVDRLNRSKKDKSKTGANKGDSSNATQAK